MPNTVTFEGNITQDPELRFTPAGTAVATFGIADNRRWNDADGKPREATDFMDIVCWQQLGENVAESLRKGMRVVIVGKARQSRWVDKDGGKHSKHELVADSVSVCLRWATVDPAAIVKNPSKGTAMPEDVRFEEDPAVVTRINPAEKVKEELAAMAAASDEAY